MGLPLKDKYRPATWAQLKGNETLKSSIKTVLERPQGAPHSFLLVGPSGCGKTTIAGILRRELGCSDIDYQIFDAANTRGIDTIREIGVSTIYSPMSGKSKVYLLDEAHKITGDGANALLKLLEEPPDHVYFILCTTDPEKLLKTIRTRCTTYQVLPLSRLDSMDLVWSICKKEGVEDFPTWAVEKIADVSDGCSRKILVILDQVLDIMDDALLAKTIEEQAVDSAQTMELCRSLIKGDWVVVSSILKVLPDEPEDVRYAVLGYFRSILLNPNSAQEHLYASSVIRCFAASVMYSGKAGLALACYDSCLSYALDHGSRR